MKGKRLLLAILVAGGISAVYSCGGGGNVFESLADKNSLEACRFQVIQDLDKGRYDAVINSSCSTAMDRGAAWFGKAGFDVNRVIDRLIEAGGNRNVNSLDTYIKILVPDNINEDMLTYLENAIREYTIAAGETPRSQGLPEPELVYAGQVRANEVADAKFNRALVQMVRGMTTIKLIMPTNTAGTLFSFFSCDINGNNVPDDVDALACALSVEQSGTLGSSGTCGACHINTASYNTTDDFSNLRRGSQVLQGTYKGITVDIQPQASRSNPMCSSSYRLLFSKIGAGYRLAITSPVSNQTCSGLNQTWPCPVIVNGNPLDFVGTITETFLQMVNDIISSVADVNPELRREIERIKQEACGPDNQCTADELRNYVTRITPTGR